MKISFTKQSQKFWRTITALSLMFFIGGTLSAQITTTDCNNVYEYCTLDTVYLAPSDTNTYTNFQWYSQGTPDVLITAGNAATYNVNADSLGVYGIRVFAPGGTYILSAEYDTPSGCATKNDTLVINFLPTPDLVMTPDTICTAGGDSLQLNTLLVDNNAVVGDTAWYTSLSGAMNGGSVDSIMNTWVKPGTTTKYYVRVQSDATDAEGGGCYAIDSVEVEVRCLELGNIVWYDTNNNGTYDSGTESGISGVRVELFLDANGDGSLTTVAEQTPITFATTDGSGLYLFDNLPEGKYFVGIPSSQFGSGEALEYLYSSGTTAGMTGVTSETTAPGPDATVSDTDDNGMLMKAGFYNGGVLTTDVVMLNFQDEPTGENPDNGTVPDLDHNLTVDFGFYGMSLGNFVFMDTDNTGAFDNADMGIPGVPVILYAEDGTTAIANTTTDADGKYLFTNLAAGTYIVAVDTTDASLAGKQSADDGPDAGTPTAVDNDDNGVVVSGGEVRSNPVVLTPGGASTGEADQGDTDTPGMSDPVVMDNANTPDGNSELQVDFGFKPICPTIDNPMGAQTICAGDAGTDLSVDISVDSMVAFMRFNDPQTGNAMYTGGTQIGSDVGPVAGTATYTFNTADFPNTSNTTPDTFYVYGIFANPVTDATCRPYAEIQVIVDPVPNATAATDEKCENTLGGAEATFTLTDYDATILNGQTGMTVSYHQTLADAQGGAGALSSPLDTGSVTIFVRVENDTYGCYQTTTLTLTVNPLPDFDLALPTVCPGENPTVQISNLTNGVNPNTMQVNAETPVTYANTILTVADGIIPNANNTITVANGNGCSQAKVIAVPDVVPIACPPVNVNVIRAGE